MLPVSSRRLSVPAMTNIQEEENPVKEKDATFEMKLDLNEAFPDSPPMMVEAWTEMENANLDAEGTKFSIMLTGSMQGNGRGLSAGDARKFAEALTMAADHVEGISRPADSKPMSYMELHDKYIRTLADLDNQRKRAKRTAEEASLSALKSMLGDFLPVSDGLNRALETLKDDDGQVSKGVRMVSELFESALAKNGIDPIKSVGETFDPSLHEALQQVESAEYAPGKIIQEFERGYMRDGKLLRAARVVVAGPGSTGGAESVSDQNQK